MITPNLSKKSKIPLYEQLYQYIKKEIKNNNIKKDTKLPSKRNLSSHLGISITTITNAYEILLDEGYIYSIERKGYYVSNLENLATININKKIKQPEKKENIKYDYSFKINKTDIDYFPIYTWRRISNKIISKNNKNWLRETDNQGIFELRNSICTYLKQSRGVNTNPNNIIIGSSTSYLFQILLNILPKNSKFAIENPGYRNLLYQLKLNNIKYNPINLEEDGIIINDLYKSKSNVLLITPSHQFPTGIITPINKRLDILKWANSSKFNYIIEDDYDSEFKYYGSPIPALKSLDTLDNVIYMGNFSKSISPQLRISYMILPNCLLEKYYNTFHFLKCPVSNLSQLTLAQFMKDGFFERHLNKMRKIYDKKRKSLINIINNNNMDNRYSIIDSKAGLHFILEVKENITEKSLINKAKNNNIYVQGLSDFFTTIPSDYCPKIIIGYGNMNTEDNNNGMIKLLKSWK